MVTPNSSHHRSSNEMSACGFRAASCVSPRLIDLHTATPQRWRNGGGWTRELMAWPADGDWQVRVSVADVEVDGPFSSFTGVQRWFCVLSGAGVELSVDGLIHRLATGDPPLRFDGAATTFCRLVDGPTRDLNLMVRGCGGSMTPVEIARPWATPPSPCGVFANVAGRCNGEPVAVHSLLWFDQPPDVLVFEADAPSAAPVGWWLAATQPEPSA